MIYGCLKLYYNNIIYLFIIMTNKTQLLFDDNAVSNIEEIIGFLISKLFQYNITNISKFKLYKLIWFSSLLMAEQYQTSIFQDYFIKKEKWPVPIRTSAFVEEIVKKNKSELIGYDNISKNFFLKKKSDFDINYWKNTWIDKVFDEIIQKYGKLTDEDLSLLSHKKAWKDAKDEDFIDLSLDLQNKDCKDLIQELYVNFYWMMN